MTAWQIALPAWAIFVIACAYFSIRAVKFAYYYCASSAKFRRALDLRHSGQARASAIKWLAANPTLLRSKAWRMTSLLLDETPEVRAELAHSLQVAVPWNHPPAGSLGRDWTKTEWKEEEMRKLREQAAQVCYASDDPSRPQTEYEYALEHRDNYSQGYLEKLGRQSGSVRMPVRPQTFAPEEICVQADQACYGPMTYREFCAAVREGRFTGSSLLRCSGERDWRTVREFVVLLQESDLHRKPLEPPVTWTGCVEAYRKLKPKRA